MSSNAIQIFIRNVQFKTSETEIFESLFDVVSLISGSLQYYSENEQWLRLIIAKGTLTKIDGTDIAM